MEFVLKLQPEEYNLVHKGLQKLSIEEALPTLRKIIAQVTSQVNENSISEEKEEA